jgi:hypothetical protein
MSTVQLISIMYFIETKFVFCLKWIYLRCRFLILVCYIFESTTGIFWKTSSPNFKQSTIRILGLCFVKPEVKVLLKSNMSQIHFLQLLQNYAKFKVKTLTVYKYTIDRKYHNITGNKCRYLLRKRRKNICMFKKKITSK